MEPLERRLREVTEGVSPQIRIVGNLSGQRTGGNSFNADFLFLFGGSLKLFKNPFTGD